MLKLIEFDARHRISFLVSIYLCRSNVQCESYGMLDAYVCVRGFSELFQTCDFFLFQRFSHSYVMSTWEVFFYY